MVVPDDALVAAAVDARTRAFAPISNYRVGAALRTADGTVVQGCNVENILLGLTCCAEKVAVFKGVSDGITEFVEVAVVTVSSPPAAPCGSCRQLMATWGVQRVICANLEGERFVVDMDELLPHRFLLKGPLPA